MSYKMCEVLYVIADFLPLKTSKSVIKCSSLNNNQLMHSQFNIY